MATMPLIVNMIMAPRTVFRAEQLNGWAADREHIERAGYEMRSAALQSSDGACGDRLTRDSGVRIDPGSRQLRAAQNEDLLVDSGSSGNRDMLPLHRFMRGSESHAGFQG
jgi:hypothetical protein